MNTHANGPTVYGIERYRLTGAEPHTTYQVALSIYADPECETTTGLVFPTATISTNRVGNAVATAKFSAQDVAPLIPEPATIHGVWTFSRADAVVYRTDCHAVGLDVPPPPPPGRR